MIIIIIIIVIICPPGKGGASHDGFGALASTTFSSLQNHKFAHDLPHPSWVHIKVHLIKDSCYLRPPFLGTRSVPSRFGSSACFFFCCSTVEMRGAQRTASSDPASRLITISSISSGMFIMIAISITIVITFIIISRQGTTIFTSSSQTNILPVETPREVPVFWSSPLKNQILIESSP